LTRPRAGDPEKRISVKHLSAGKIKGWDKKFGRISLLFTRRGIFKGYHVRPRRGILAAKLPLPKNFESSVRHLVNFYRSYLGRRLSVL
jgi:hypothetical protein